MKIYEIEILEKAESDILKLKKAGKKAVLKKIKGLLGELKVHPETGTGKPERLKGDKAGRWSRRISEKHRLIYQINDTLITVIVLSAYGHYDDK